MLIHNFAIYRVSSVSSITIKPSIVHLSKFQMCNKMEFFVEKPLNRLRGTRIVKEIAYGNIARRLGDCNTPLPSYDPWLRSDVSARRDTHCWTIFLRSINNEYMFSYIKCVEFHLHKSFKDSLRIVDSPPYEVTESGWGEFEVKIKINFHEETKERSVHIYHYLKIEHDDETTRNITINGCEYVVSDKIDQLVFCHPTNILHYYLTHTPLMSNIPCDYYTDLEKRMQENIKNIELTKKKWLR